MIAGTVLVGGTAGVLIPFQGVPTMSLTVFDKYAEQTGLLVDRGAYVTAVVMSSVLLILCFTFLARKVLRLDVTPLKRLNVADIVEGQAQPQAGDHHCDYAGVLSVPCVPDAAG